MNPQVQQYIDLRYYKVTCNSVLVRTHFGLAKLNYMVSLTRSVEVISELSMPYQKNITVICHSSVTDLYNI